MNRMWHGRWVIAITVAALLAVGGPVAPVATAATGSATLTSSDGNGLDGFGNAVAMSGDIVVVGAPWHDAGDDINTDEGAAYVYQRGQSGWASGTELAVLTASDAEPGDRLGWAVAISGDVIAVSAIRANGGAGAVYVFVKPTGGWQSTTETSYLRSSTPEILDLGWSLTMSNDVIVAGAPSHDTATLDDAGAALLFSKPSGGWPLRAAGDVTESRFLTLPTPSAHGSFGLSVAMAGSVLVVGSPGEGPYQGAAYVYQADLTIGWSTITLLARLSASDGAWNDAFGAAVAVKGRLVAVGAPCDDDLDGTGCVGLPGEHSWGSVYLFREPFSGWASTTQLARLHAASPIAFESLGSAVAINDDGVYAGAASAYVATSHSGRVYRFVQPAAGWSDTTEAGVEYQAKDHFGKSLAGAGHTLAIGDSSGFTGGEVTIETVDETPPTTTISVAPDDPDGQGGWYITPPTVVVSASDPGGAVASIRCAIDPDTAPAAFDDLPPSCELLDPGAPLSTDGTHVVYAASSDSGGNTSAVEAATIMVDTAAPTTAIVVSPPAPDGSNGWYSGPVGVTVSATDDGSGVAATRCVTDPVAAPAAFADLPTTCSATGDGDELATDGTHRLFAAARDDAGLTGSIESSPLISIDGTAPVLTCRESAFVLNGAGAVIADVTDATSGPASSTASSPADIATVGAKTASIGGTDLAGNAADTDCPYVVGYAVTGPIGLKGAYRLGSTIPVRIGLGTASGVRISDPVAAALAASCGVRAVLGDGDWLCATYDRRSDEFVAAVRISRTAAGGSALLVVEVRAGTVVVNTNRSTVSLR